MVKVALGLAGLTGLAIFVSFLGDLHPIGDSFAVFRRLLSVGLGALGLAIAVTCLKYGVAVLAVAVGGWASTMGGAAPDQVAMTVYQKNLSYRLLDLAPVAEDIRASGADVVTLQEVSRTQEPLLRVLAEAYPHQLLCPNFRGVGGVAVLSRHRIGASFCAEVGGMGGAELHLPGDLKVWVISIHLHWPWPYRQADHVSALLPSLEAFAAPIVIGGDFNMVAWSQTMARLRASSKTQSGPRLWSTFDQFHPVIALPIDHVLAPGGVRADLRPNLGSDHRGILAEVGF